MSTEFYVRLNHEEYKKLEEQFKNFRSLETSHTSVRGFYHKAFRILVGTTIFEFMGPTVPKPKK